MPISYFGFVSRRIAVAIRDAIPAYQQRAESQKLRRAKQLPYPRVISIEVHDILIFILQQRCTIIARLKEFIRFKTSTISLESHGANGGVAYFIPGMEVPCLNGVAAELAKARCQVSTTHRRFYSFDYLEKNDKRSARRLVDTTLL